MHILGKRHLGHDAPPLYISLLFQKYSLILNLRPRTMSPGRLNTLRYAAAGPAPAGEGSSSTAGGGVRRVRDSASAAAPHHGQRRAVESQVEREPAPNASSGQVLLADPVLLAAPVSRAAPVSTDRKSVV